MFEINCRLGLAPTLLRDVLAAMAVGTGQLWPVRNLSAPGYPEKDMERVLREACCSNSRAKTCSIWSLTRILLVPLNTKTPQSLMKQTELGRRGCQMHFIFLFYIYPDALENFRAHFFRLCTWPFSWRAKLASYESHLYITNHYMRVQMTYTSLHHVQLRAHFTRTHTHASRIKEFLGWFLGWKSYTGRLIWFKRPRAAIGLASKLKVVQALAARAWRHRQLKKRG